MYLATSSKKVPDELAGTSGMHFFSLVAKVYESGKGGELEGSVVHHMMLHLLQQLAGVPHPQVSSKLFALARAMRRIHKPSYEFFRLNTLVGPHVKTIQKFEAKTASHDLVITPGTEGCVDDGEVGRLGFVFLP